MKVAELITKLQTSSKDHDNDEVDFMFGDLQRAEIEDVSIHPWTGRTTVILQYLDS